MQPGNLKQRKQKTPPAKRKLRLEKSMPLDSLNTPANFDTGSSPGEAEYLKTYWIAEELHEGEVSLLKDAI